MDHDEFICKWAPSEGSERRNKDLFLSELCDVLGVPRPDAATNDPAKDLYIFEKPIPTWDEEGKSSQKSADLYKHGCFLLEAKQSVGASSKLKGKTKRGTQGWDVAMSDAYGQARGYLDALDEPPPFLIVCDIGYAFELYADFDKSRRWNPFPNAQKKRIYLKDIAVHAETLRAIFCDPYSLDPSRRAEKVTREVAFNLAELAKKLEEENHHPEEVAKFLMRCLFTMFAEDVGLLPKNLLSQAIEEQWIPQPHTFAPGIQHLWQAMNEGLYFGFIGKLLRFNGGLFAEPSALVLERDSLALLLVASKKDWSDVEPSIFGTLLERALNPRERHMLGAHYTPRAYVERLIRPTIEEPLREEWENVQIAARKLYLDGKDKEALQTVRLFHQKLCATRVLDPACGSGNFLYVTLDLFKRLESEVLALMHDLGEHQELLHAEGIRVTPGQFLGIEVKPWAKEIAELVLWIGYLQWHYRTHGRLTPPPEPVLRDFKNIECRDAVLAYDRAEMVFDAKGKAVTRWDGVTMKKHHQTGENVPDEKATVLVYRYVNPRKALWPQADFIVGNPPFIGNWRMRSELGDGYTEALRATYPEVPESVDFVLYWWHKAAELVKAKKLRRFGLITTNSLSQAFGRRVIEPFVSDEPKGSIVFAIPDHPWVDSEGGADVRIAMTVGALGEFEGKKYTVVREMGTEEGHRDVELVQQSGQIHADLKIGVNLGAVCGLRANMGISSRGVSLHGAGFIVTENQARALGLGKIEGLERHIRPYRNGRDLAANSRDVMVIDLDGLTCEQVIQRFPAVYQWLLNRVKPERDQNQRESYSKSWWIFGEPRRNLRPALAGLSRYISTVETSKHRFFVFLDASILPDNMLVNMALEDAFFLGVLSSRIHITWALAAGGRLGVGNDPRYTKSRCFDPFPFPEASAKQKKLIRSLGEKLDLHRKRQQEAHSELTMTGMYNVLEKLRRDEDFSHKDRVIYDQGIVSILKSIHDELDAAVFAAYGWSPELSDEQILEKLVALNRQRAAEEEEGLIRWLRPDFQNPQPGKEAIQTQMMGMGESSLEDKVKTFKPSARAWPRNLGAQIKLVREYLQDRRGVFSPGDIAHAFKGSKVKELEELLDGLSAFGVLRKTADGRFRVLGQKRSG